MNETELHPAFFWDCDECGTENFVRGIEGNIDEAALSANQESVAPFLTSDEYELDGEAAMAPVLVQVICLAPKTVKCRECGREFRGKVWTLEE